MQPVHHCGSLLWPRRQATMPTRLLYAGAREPNSCPHTCVVSTLSTESQPLALRLACRTTLNFSSSCLHFLSARIGGMDYQCLVYSGAGGGTQDFLRTLQVCSKLNSHQPFLSSTLIHTALLIEFSFPEAYEGWITHKGSHCTL